MGRKRINISPIQNETARKSTFEKRRVGLLKKAMELSILCGVPVSVTLEEPDEKHDLCIYSSHPFEEAVLDKFESVSNYKLFTNEHFDDMVPGRYSCTKDNIGYRISKASSTRSSTFSHSVENEQDPPMLPPMLPPPVIPDEQKNTMPFIIDTNWQKHETSRYYQAPNQSQAAPQINSKFAEDMNNQMMTPPPFDDFNMNGLMPNSPSYNWNHNGFDDEIKPLPLIFDETDSMHTPNGKRRQFEMMDDDITMIPQSPAKRRRLNSDQPIFEPEIYNFRL